VYLDFLTRDRIADWDLIRFDADGVPTLQRDSQWVYNPVTISQYGLQEYSYYLDSGGAQHLAAAQAAGDWLVRSQDPATGVWPYDYDFAVGGMDETLLGPWSSAMAQGQAISLLTRLAHATGGTTYMPAAEAGLAPLHRAVADGGLTAGFFDGQPFYEEYPTTPPSFTLNGFMFTLFGLYDLEVLDGSVDAGQLYSSGLSTLAAALRYYDTGGISAYHLGHLTKPPRPVHASLKYHWIHVMELRALDSVSPNATFRKYRDRWAAYVAPGPPKKPPAPAPTPLPRPEVPAPLDRTAPRVAGVRAMLRGKRVTEVRLRLSERAVLRLELRRRCLGKSGHCRRGHRLLLRSGAPGANSLRIAHRDGRRLWRGRLRLRLVAVDAAGNSSQAVTLHVRRRRG
jgi:heparosan-N-sulfate-glucuronate 5-epimerase